MRNYFYKLNQTYINNFFRNIYSTFSTVNIKTDVNFLMLLFKELNNLFRFIGGKVSNKNNIPKSTDYPDVKKFNTIINEINIDTNKIYTAQKIIESDVNNLLNFDSIQRIKTFENLTSTQQDVYSVYIKNKNTIDSEYIIPSENPFASSDNLSEESKNVTIDQLRKSLTLDYSSFTDKSIDISNVDIYFSNVFPDKKVYPNNIKLHVGSHWKIDSDNHFISDNRSIIENYKQRMIDSQNNTGIGWCEFEAVKTTIDENFIIEPKKIYRLKDIKSGTYDTIISNSFVSPSEVYLKEYIGKLFNKDKEFIFLDIQNSLQGEYISDNSVIIFNSINKSNEPNYKLVIPFLDSIPLTNEIVIDFEPDNLGYFPVINWEESKIYTTSESFKFNKQYVPNDNGEYRCVIDKFIKPKRIELILYYPADYMHWTPIDFYMSRYNYTAQQNYYLEQQNGDKILIVLNKSYDIFVDSEPDQDKEENRALNVLIGRKI